MRVRVQIIIFCIAAFLTTACNLQQFFAQSVQPAQVLMNATYTGGRCIHGICNASYTVYSNGTLLYERGDGMTRSVQLEYGELNLLTGAIETTNYEVIRAQPFTDMCPTAYDGQEIVYTFHTSQGEEVISSCQYVVSENVPVFRLFNDMLNRYREALSE